MGPQPYGGTWVPAQLAVLRELHSNSGACMQLACNEIANHTTTFGMARRPACGGAQ